MAERVTHHCGGGRERSTLQAARQAPWCRARRVVPGALGQAAERVAWACGERGGEASVRAAAGAVPGGPDGGVKADCAWANSASRVRRRTWRTAGSLPVSGRHSTAMSLPRRSMRVGTANSPWQTQRTNWPIRLSRAWRALWARRASLEADPGALFLELDAETLGTRTDLFGFLREHGVDSGERGNTHPRREAVGSPRVASLLQGHAVLIT